MVVGLESLGRFAGGGGVGDPSRSIAAEIGVWMSSD